MIIDNLDTAAVAACDLLKALACPSRLRILCHLADGEKSVGQVAELVGIRKTAASQHLTLLRKDRLVRCRRAGQTMFYTLDHPEAERLLHVLRELYCSVPAAPDSTTLISHANQEDCHAQGLD
jgi:DNA-binding transcriptional ArsR family regulator